MKLLKTVAALVSRGLRAGPASVLLCLVMALVLLPLPACETAPADESAEDPVGEAQSEVGVPGIGKSPVWTPLGVTTSAGSFAAVDFNNTVYGVYRDSQGALRISAGVNGAGYVPNGAPSLASDALSAVVDRATNQLFVAVRTIGGDIVVGSTATPANAGGWTWTALGWTDGAPSLTVGCNNVHVAVRWGGWTWLKQRPTNQNNWSGWNALTPSPNLPTLATNSWGVVGMALTGNDQNTYFWINDCGNPGWQSQGMIGDGTTKTAEQQVGLTAYGPLFAIAVRGLDGFPYFMLQRLGFFFTTPFWPSTYELVVGQNTSSSQTVSNPIIEAPTVYTFRGLVFVAARDPNSAVRYWIRNTNRLTPDDRVWVGGRIVSGWGAGAIPTVLVASDRGNLTSVAAPGQTQVPLELYVFTRGIGDQQMYGLNMSRFAALDILEGVYNMRVDTTYAGNSVPKADVPNVFEDLVSFLRMPEVVWPGLATPTACGFVNDGRGYTLFPNLLNGGEYVDCCCTTNVNGMPVNHSDGIVVDGTTGSSFRIWEEFGHVAWAPVVNNASDPVGTTFSSLQPRLCTINTDCGVQGNPVCVMAGQVGPYMAAQVGGPTKICAVNDAYVGLRPQGFVLDYAASTDAHNWIYTTILYRWFGDDLRTMASQDAANGEPRLQEKYTWIMNNVYGFRQYFGTRNEAQNAPTSDESLGEYALPTN